MKLIKLYLMKIYEKPRIRFSINKKKNSTYAVFHSNRHQKKEKKKEGKNPGKIAKNLRR